MGKLLTVKISEIRENEVALRKVNQSSEDFLGLVASIRGKGFFGAISVREKTGQDGVKYYELVDGLHRYTAAKAAGLDKINVDVVDLKDAEVLEAQIMANCHKVETRPIEYTNQLKRIIAMNPMMTEAELASKLGRSLQWIQNRLSLTAIENADIASLVDDGKIKLSNAYCLAKLPPAEQKQWVDRAMTDAPEVFGQAVDARVREIRNEARQGRAAQPVEFQPVATLQKLADIKGEMDAGKVGAELTKGLKTPAEGFAMAVKWILHLDPASIAVQKAKDDERKRAAAEAAEKRKAEREAKKAAAGAEASAKVNG